MTLGLLIGIKNGIKSYIVWLGYTIPLSPFTQTPMAFSRSRALEHVLQTKVSSQLRNEYKSPIHKCAINPIRYIFGLGPRINLAL